MSPLLNRTKSALTNTYGALTRVVGGLWTRYGGLGWSRVRLFLPSARFDWEREAGDPWSNSIVALAISWLGDRFSRPLLRVSKIDRNGDFVPQARHGLVDLWNKPNPHYGRKTMEKAVGLSLKCDGNAYIDKVRDRMGRVCQLWWIPHFRILPVWPPDGSKYIDGYRVWLDVGQYVLPPEDIIHIRDGIDPRNERLGLSALRSNIRECVAVNMESSYTAALLKNSGVPGLAVVPKIGELRPDKAKAQEIKERFGENFGGDEAGGTAVLAGPYEIVKVGFSPEELRLDRLPLNAIARIASAIGVATMSLGLPDPNKTYSNIEAADRMSWGTIVALQEIVDDALRWQLLPEFGDDPNVYVVEHDYSHVQELQESLDAVHARAREDYTAGGIRLNEWREQIGFEPDPDGDRFAPGTEAEAMVDPVDGEEGHPMKPGKGKVRQDVQQTALNGAQIASLVQIVEAIGLGQIPAESARAMIAAAFPALDPDAIEQIVGPAEDHEVPLPPVVVAKPGLPAPNGDAAKSFHGRNGGGY